MSRAPVSAWQDWGRNRNRSAAIQGGWLTGREVLISPYAVKRPVGSVENIDWASESVYVSLTREQVKNSPQYHEAAPVTRDYEKQLHAAYDRGGYWP